MNNFQHDSNIVLSHWPSLGHVPSLNNHGNSNWPDGTQSHNLLILKFYIFVFKKSDFQI